MNAASDLTGVVDHDMLLAIHGEILQLEADVRNIIAFVNGVSGQDHRQAIREPLPNVTRFIADIREARRLFRDTVAFQRGTKRPERLPMGGEDWKSWLGGQDER